MAPSRRVLTIGTFDLFHAGHERLLERCAWFGLVEVGVNTDRFVNFYKGRSPAEHQAIRVLHVRRMVRHVHLNDGPGIELIRKVMPDILAIGSDWLGRDYPTQLGTTAEELAGLGISVLFLPRTPGISTTELREAA